MYSKILLIALALSFLLYVFYKVKKYLKKMSKVGTADSIEKVVNKVGNDIINNFVPNERIKKIIKKFPKLFKDKKYFNNFDELLNVVTDILSDKEKAAPFFSGIKGKIVVTDDDKHPLQLTEAMLETTKKIIEPATSDQGKALALFNWFEANVVYGEDKRGEVGYRSASEVFETAEGVCGEMSILFMVMARIAGLEANYVHVGTDVDGKEVNHACVAVICSGKQILIDPAYHAFDIAHRSYVLVTDQELVGKFKSYQ